MKHSQKFSIFLNKFLNFYANMKTFEPHFPTQSEPNSVMILIVTKYIFRSHLLEAYFMRWRYLRQEATRGLLICIRPTRPSQSISNSVSMVFCSNTTAHTIVAATYAKALLPLMTPSHRQVWCRGREGVGFQQQPTDL